jgi:ABC-type transport system involved in cytochrome c biogenesis ATPase subunit
VVKFEFRPAPRSGDQVAVIEGIRKSYGKRVIYDGFSMIVRRGERWAVMGRNGAGKSTLLKMMAGALRPDSGEVRLGASLKMGYFAQQSLEVLDPELTVVEQLQRTFRGRQRGCAKAFQFSRRCGQAGPALLAARNALAMARMLYDPPNLWCWTNRRTIWIDKRGAGGTTEELRGTMVCFTTGTFAARFKSAGRYANQDRPEPAGVSGILRRIRGEAGP